MRYIGIDPGITGAIACIDDQANLIRCEDLPIVRDGKLAWVDGQEMTSILMQCRDGFPARILIERSQPMPGQGVSSTFMIGVVLGSIVTACQGIAPLTFVTASVWKRAMGLTSDKATSLDKARLLFPTADLDRKKDHNRAEAILLSSYARSVFTGKAVAA